MATEKQVEVSEADEDTRQEGLLIPIYKFIKFRCHSVAVWLKPSGQAVVEAFHRRAKASVR
jgi:hypothetical protein